MCECFKEIEKAMKDRFSAERVKARPIGYTGVAVRRYTEKGEVSKHDRHEAVNWNVCPICGEPWEKDTQQDLLKRTLSNGKQIKFTCFLLGR